MDQDEEREIISRVLQGDRDAFSRLVEAHKVPVFNLAYRMTGVYDDARDLAQEAFVRAFRRIRTFREGRRFFPWLYAIALNCIRDHERTAGRRKSSEVRDETGEGGPERGVPEMEQALIAGEEANLVQNLLGSLHREMREAVILRFYQDLSFEEMAEILGVSQSAAKMRVYRGLQRMKELLAPRKD